jgi:hypothetical protein
VASAAARAALALDVASADAVASAAVFAVAIAEFLSVTSVAIADAIAELRAVASAATLAVASVAAFACALDAAPAASYAAAVAANARAFVKYRFDPSARSPVSWFERLETVPVTLPVKLPTIDAVIVPAAKLPEPSRFTTVLGVLAVSADPPTVLMMKAVDASVNTLNPFTVATEPSTIRPFFTLKFLFTIAIIYDSSYCFILTLF